MNKKALQLSACVFLLLSIAVNSLQIQANKDFKTDDVIEKKDPDDDLLFMDMVKSHNYDVEKHIVTTEDGYILTVFRMYGSPSCPPADNKSVVFLQHGILDSAATWVNNGPGLAPAYLLADKCYDVWLGNSRGSYYSRNHRSLNPDKDKEFWEFSFVEMGRYDITASVDYVLKETKQEKLAYMGHSQGTTQMFLSLSEKLQWWQSRIHSYVAVGPVCKVHNAQSTLLKTLAYTKAYKLVQAIGIHEMLPRNYLQNKIFAKACQIAPFLCSAGIYFIADSETKFNNPAKQQVLIAHFPSGTSLMSLTHYAQMITNDNFAYFDYGEEENMKKYGQKTPPNIDLGKIKNIPTALFIGNYDELGDVKDNEFIKQNLGENSLQLTKYVEGGHMTFLVGKNSDYMNDVFDFIKKNESVDNQVVVNNE